MRITREFIFAGISDAGGWSRAQVEELGVEWPLKSGWIDLILGKEISNLAAETFINLKNAHITGHYADSIAARNHMKDISH